MKEFIKYPKDWKQYQAKQRQFIFRKTWCGEIAWTKDNHYSRPFAISLFDKIGISFKYGIFKIK